MGVFSGPRLAFTQIHQQKKFYPHRRAQAPKCEQWHIFPSV
nr:MAG TPA_asm: hypothetical protein [Caudoviricetes sp.]